MTGTVNSELASQLERLAVDHASAVERAINEFEKRYPNTTDAQRVKEKFVSAITAASTDALKRLGKPPAYQYQTDLSYLLHSYPQSYTGPKNIGEQVGILREAFPHLGVVAKSVATHVVPPGMEGYFAIPPWEKIATNYGEAVQKVFDALKAQRGEFWYYYTSLHDDFKTHLRQSSRSVEMWQRLAEQQKDPDILLVPAQFGLKYRDRSVRWARELMPDNEFGLGTFAVAIMLLTHCHRLRVQDDLRVICAGDEFDMQKSKDPPLSHVPYFTCGFGLHFGIQKSEESNSTGGSVSGWV